MVAADIDIQLSRTAALAMARMVTQALLSGRMGLAKAERAVLLIDAAGWHEVASGLRCAVVTRRAVLTGRGFTAARVSP